MKAFVGMMNANCELMVDVEKSARQSFLSWLQIWCGAFLGAKYLETIVSSVASSHLLDHCHT